MTFDESDDRPVTRRDCTVGDRRWTLLALPIVVSVLVTIGCDIPRRPPINTPSTVDRGVVDSEQTLQTQSVEQDTLFDEDWEAWDAYFLNGKHVGYSHVVAEGLGDTIGEFSEPRVQFTIEDQIRFRRGSGSFVQHFTQTSSETSVGVLLDFESTLHVGPSFRRYRGIVQEGQLQIETVQGGERATRRIDWQATDRGLLGVQQSLRRKPMIEGERRTLKTLSPIQYEVASVELYCTGEAAVPVIDGEYRKFTEIEARYVVGDAGVNQTIWTNKSGEIQKTHRQVDGLVSYRTDKATALDGATAVDDLLKSTKIDVTGTLDRPDQTSRVTFVVRPQRGARANPDLMEIRPQPDQYLRKRDDGGLEIVVDRNNLQPPAGFETAVLEPTSADQAPSLLIDFQTRLISQLATAVRKLDNRRQLALDLTATVSDLMTPQNVSHGMISASEVANSPQGSCVEHAIFLAAMLRAREIPSRLAIGFVYSPGEQPAMSYHVWNLAHVDGRWIALDAVLGSEAPADRITITTTNLSGEKESSVLRPIMASLGLLEVEIRSAEF